ncbi:transmembrane protein 104-like isoform X2 [Dendronephthya gigantea]|uniref:transmembrane protein 104-like isoform X2 n=1 Tax=Dendronephthya gigantea TaxID=151771 RepID=UPI00106BC35F|nr:transmembrane protein 104-like isoform X2 [Dendronephthya gigantea]
MTDNDSQYNSLAGFVYIFNLIVGAGALALPKAFSEAGLLLSAIIIVILAFLSFMTCSFMVEAMAIANAVLQQKEKAKIENHEIETLQDESRTLLSNNAEINGQPSFEIRKKVEMGEMARMFFGKIGIRLFYLCIAVYLYGDLAIYATAVPKSMRDVICETSESSGNDSNNTNVSISSSGQDDDKCCGLRRDDVYRILVAAFAVLVCPFAFTNVQKTKYIQYLTTFLRWLCFSFMIVLALIHLGKGKGNGRPSVADFSGIPDLFGASVYSFMCQHSLPSLITPLKSKKNVTTILFMDVGVALLFYSLLSFTALFTFVDSEIEDVYTLSFKHITSTGISTFLALYPVFALSASFPIISITLRENLKALFHKDDRKFPWIVDRIGFPLFAVLPPIVIALSTTNVEMLVSLTGSYAGVGVQYIIPTMLIVYGRQKAAEILGFNDNDYGSFFKHRFWTWMILSWTLLSVGVVTAYNIKKRI